MAEKCGLSNQRNRLVVQTVVPGGHIHQSVVKVLVHPLQPSQTVVELCLPLIFGQRILQGAPCMKTGPLQHASVA